MQVLSRTCVLLAGGKSQRMGADKATIRIQGRRLIDLQLGRIAEQTENIYLSSEHNYQTSRPYIPDLKRGPRGPAAGLFSVYAKFSSSRNFEGFFTVPVDAPNFPDDLLLRLYHKSNSAIAADCEVIHPTFAWWRMPDLKRAFDSLANQKNVSLRKVSAVARAQTIVWSERQSFYNLNTPDELKEFASSISVP